MSPFVSQAQRAWMYANRPKMAAEWEAETPKGKRLPERVAGHRGSSEHPGWRSVAKHSKRGR